MRAREFVTENWSFRNKNKIYQLLVDQTGSGPFDGGCVVFAQALQLKYGGKIVVLVGRTSSNGINAAQHAAVHVDNYLIDADGPAEPDKFVQRFIENEIPNGDVVKIRPIQDQDLPDAPRDRDLATKISRLL